MHCGERLQAKVPAGDSHERLVCSGCGFVHYLNPRPVAGTIPVREDGRFLLLRRDIEPRRGYWVFPGGFMDLGETAEEAAIRETREEACLEVDDVKLLGVYTRTVPGVVVIVYEARAVGTAAIGEETMEIGWFRPDGVPWDMIAFDSTEAALRDFLRGRGHPVPATPIIPPVGVPGT